MIEDGGTYGENALKLTTSLPRKLKGYFGHATLLKMKSIGLLLNRILYKLLAINKGRKPSIRLTKLAAH